MTGAQLTAQLKEWEMTPSEFADTIGVTRGAVLHWINDRRSIPQIVLRLIDYFNDYHLDIRGFYEE